MIKELRQEKGLSQDELARAIGFSQGNLGKWERNIHDPPTEAIIALAKFFGVTTDYLLGLEDNEVIVTYPDYSKYRTVQPLPTLAESSGRKPATRKDIMRQLDELEAESAARQISMIGKGGKTETYDLDEEDADAVRRMLEALRKDKKQ